MLDPIMDVSDDNFSKVDAVNDDDEDKSLASGQSSGTFQKPRESIAVEEIAGYENRLVLYSKLLVFLVLACSAAAVGVLTFYFVTSEEENDYTAQVRSQIGRIVLFYLIYYYIL
jgi:hypothetical protein